MLKCLNLFSWFCLPDYIFPIQLVQVISGPKYVTQYLSLVKFDPFIWLLLDPNSALDFAFVICPSFVSSAWLMTVCSSVWNTTGVKIGLVQGKHKALWYITRKLILGYHDPLTSTTDFLFISHWIRVAFIVLCLIPKDMRALVKNLA